MQLNLWNQQLNGSYKLVAQCVCIFVCLCLSTSVKCRWINIDIVLNDVENIDFGNICMLLDQPLVYYNLFEWRGIGQ